MLKWYADTFKLGGAELTEANLRRLKRLTLAGLPSFILYPLGMSDILPPVSKIITLVLALISAIFFLVVMMSPFTNRFWSRDKYLDEWERGRKRHAMAIGHQVMTYMFICLAIALFVVSFFTKTTINLSFLTISHGLGGVICCMVLVPHIFLLWTVKPVELTDEDEKQAFEEKSRQNLRLLAFGSGLIVGGFLAGFIWAVTS